MLSFVKYATEIDLSIYVPIREKTGMENSLEWMMMRNIYRYIQMNLVKDTLIINYIYIPLKLMF